MGNYDTFYARNAKLSIQLKVGNCECRGYIEGSRVDSKEFPDAVYHAPEGVVVIADSLVRSVTAKIPESLPFKGDPIHITKWGDVFNPDRESVNDYHPMKRLPSDVV